MKANRAAGGAYLDTMRGGGKPQLNKTMVMKGLKNPILNVNETGLACSFSSFETLCVFFYVSQYSTQPKAISFSSFETLRVFFYVSQYSMQPKAIC